MPTGSLKIHVFKGDSYIPLENAKISVIQNKETSNKQFTQALSTDSSGITNEIELEAPPLEYSIKPSDKQPYSLCKIIVDVPGYKKLTINGCQIYPGITSIQHCFMNPISIRQPDEDIIGISPNTLFGDYPTKIPESEMPNPISELGEGFYVPLEDQKIPDTIRIHDGQSNNTNAPNFVEYYKNYIRNVLSSEIYPTWHKESIKANAYAIISFTLNRIFTEWYRGKGKNFDITSSTATDHKYTRNIQFYAGVDMIVNEVFNTYIKVANYEFPFLAQYTDGRKISKRRGWMTQWGSENLADQGKNAFEILKYFYGPDITLFKLNKFGHLTPSFPEYSLQVGSKGDPVTTIQKSLNTICKNYTKIGKLTINGTFDNNTKKSVETFQGIFSLPKTGIVDYATWYKISDIYVGISENALKNSRLVERNPIFLDSISCKNCMNYKNCLRSSRLIERTFIPPFLNECIYNVPTLTFLDDED